MLIVAMIIAIAFCFSIGVAAETNDAYLVGEPISYDQPIDVTVIIESRKDSTTSQYISEILDVTLGRAGVNGQTFTVRDAMYTISANSMAGLKMYNANGAEITSNATYIYSMSQNGVTYAPALPSASYTLDGWMFRVNDKLPLDSWGDGADAPVGTGIADTPVADGDVIHFYWDYPYQESQTSWYSTNYIAPTATYDDDHTVTVDLQYSWNYFDNNFVWVLSGFNLYTNYTVLTANILDANKNLVDSKVITPNDTTINVTLTAGQTYYVQIMPTFKTVGNYQLLDSTMGFAKINT